MTDRISHEDATGLVDLLSGGNWSLSAARKLRDYIAQQRAAEADTVPRAEHKAALQQVREAWSKESAAEKAAHRVVEDELEARLTALKAEHERIKLDFANTCDVGRKLEARVARLVAQQADMETEHERVKHNEQLQMKRATRAEERVAELEGAARDSLDDLDDGDAQGCAQTLRRALEAASPSPAPEASVQPKEDCGATGWQKGCGKCNRCTGRSPAPAVTEASVHPTIADRLRSGLPPFPAPWLADGLREAASASPDVAARVEAHPSGYLPRPDYVTYDVLIEALRHVHQRTRNAAGETNMTGLLFGLAADQLEKAREL